MRTGYFQAVGCVCTGVYHELTGRPCQDAVARRTDGSVGAAALSDGAGSCPHAERASRLMTQWATDYFSSHFDALFAAQEEDAVRAIVSAAQEALLELHQPLDESLCTLLLFAVDRSGRWIAAHIGDGVALMQEGDNVSVLSMPENGADSSETWFLASEDAAQHLRLHRGQAQGTVAALLTSDGCSGSFYNPQEGIASAVGQILSWLDKYPEDIVEAELCRRMETDLKRQGDDDMSLAILRWVAQEEDAPDAALTEEDGEDAPDAALTEEDGEDAPDAAPTEEDGEDVPDAAPTEEDGEDAPDAAPTEEDGEDVPDAAPTEDEDAADAALTQGRARPMKQLTLMQKLGGVVQLFWRKTCPERRK